MPPPIVQNTVVMQTLDGVTTALVAFLFACLIFPHLVKNKTQYYVSLACVVLIILIHTLGLVFRSSTGWVVFGGFLIGLLQITALVMLVLCAGGQTIGQLGGELANAYEVIRRGEEEKEVIVPLRGTQPRPREPGAGGAGSRAADEDRVVYTIDPATGESPKAPPGASVAPPPKPAEGSSLPLD